MDGDGGADRRESLDTLGCEVLILLRAVGLVTTGKSAVKVEVNREGIRLSGQLDLLLRRNHRLAIFRSTGRFGLRASSGSGSFGGVEAARIDLGDCPCSGGDGAAGKSTRGDAEGVGGEGSHGGDGMRGGRREGRGGRRSSTTAEKSWYFARGGPFGVMVELSDLNGDNARGGPLRGSSGGAEMTQW